MKDNLVNIRILVVEDDSALLKVLSTYIKKSGAIVYQASNGQAAFEIVEKEEIDFVLSDIQMPIMNGVELLKKIRTKDLHMPIVLLATGQAELTKEEAIGYGASGLIHKPFNLKSLNMEILNLISNSEK